MKKSFNILGAILTCTLLSSSLLAASDKFVAFPIFTDDTWKPNFEVAAVAGHVDFLPKGIDSGTMYGMELSFDCPVFTLPGDNLLRQQLNLNQYDKNGLRVTTIEMNPYYFVDITEDLVFGFGPGIGGVHADLDGGKDQWMLAAQVGAGVKYYIDGFIIGADLRRQWTASKDFGNGNQDLDNMRFLLKAGYRF